MNNSKFFCHSCDKVVDHATHDESTGELKCDGCKNPYVEILSDTEDEQQTPDDDMEIADWDSNLSLEQVLMDEEPDQAEAQTTYNFNFNVNINGQNVFSSSSNSSRNPQPYSFSNVGERTEFQRMPQPPRRREPQPYSQSFRQPSQQQRRRQPRFFPEFTMPDFQGLFPNFEQPRGWQTGPTFVFSGFNGFGMQPPQGFPRGRNVNPRDFFQGNMNDLLAQMHRQHEAENGKPPAPKSAIDMLPTHTLTKETADCLADSCCAVCQDNYKVGEQVCKLPCGHEYHKDCVVPWLERHCTCPVCRHEVGESQQSEVASRIAA